jgi:hypothetical protein
MTYSRVLGENDPRRHLGRDCKSSGRAGEGRLSIGIEHSTLIGLQSRPLSLMAPIDVSSAGRFTGKRWLYV